VAIVVRQKDVTTGRNSFLRMTAARPAFFTEKVAGGFSTTKREGLELI